MQGIALGIDEQTVQLFILSAVELQLYGLLTIEARQIDIGGVLKISGWSRPSG